MYKVVNKSSHEEAGKPCRLDQLELQESPMISGTSPRICRKDSPTTHVRMRMRAVPLSSTLFRSTVMQE